MNTHYLSSLLFAGLCNIYKKNNDMYESFEEKKILCIHILLFHHARRSTQQRYIKPPIPTFILHEIHTTTTYVTRTYCPSGKRLRQPGRHRREEVPLQGVLAEAVPKCAMEVLARGGEGTHAYQSPLRSGHGKCSYDDNDPIGEL